MKLYNLDHSPYAARVRMYIYQRQLPVELAAPRGGMGSDEYKALTPTGKVPVLVDGDRHLAESTAIMEYLESVFPEAPLASGEPWVRAQQTAMMRFMDLYFAQALFPLFQQLRAPQRDPVVVASGLENLRTQLQTLEQWYSLDELAPGEEFSFVDCAVLPILFYVVTLAPMFGEENVLAATPLVSARWDWGNNQPMAKKVLEEMAAGLKSAMGG
ncbi:MAG: glutathione S-transferase family protein [Spongiibacteraceae bacterium]